MEPEKATLMIDSLTTDLVAYVKKKLQEKLAKKPKPEGAYRGGNVHTFGDMGNGYLILVEDGEIVYFVRHRAIKHNGFQLGRQVLVWRKKGSFAAAGFSSHVFFKILLPKYGALIADQEQTEDGRQFWMVATGLAFQQNLNVYFLDRRSSPNQLIQLQDDQELRKYKDAIWGTTQGHRRTFVVLSNKLLTLKSR